MGRVLCCCLLLLHGSDNRIEGVAWAHGLAGQLRVRRVVATDIHWLALYGVELGDDGRFVRGQGLGQFAKLRLQCSVFGLGGQVEVSQTPSGNLSISLQQAFSSSVAALTRIDTTHRRRGPLPRRASRLPRTGRRLA